MPLVSAPTSPGPALLCGPGEAQVLQLVMDRDGSHALVTSGPALPAVTGEVGCVSPSPTPQVTGGVRSPILTFTGLANPRPLPSPSQQGQLYHAALVGYRLGFPSAATGKRESQLPPQGIFPSPKPPHGRWGALNQLSHSHALRASSSITPHTQTTTTTTTTTNGVSSIVLLRRGHW